MVLLALSIWIIPFVAPNFSMFCVLRSIITVFLATVDSIPFTADYVKKESRGQACSMNALFCGIFQVINFQILVPYSEKVSYQVAFTTVGISVLVVTVLLLIMTREPKPKQRQAKLVDLSIDGS